MRLTCDYSKMKTLPIMLLAVVFFSLSAIGQQLTIHGKVVDRQGSPLPGVTIVLKGTSQGVITDSQGNYTFSEIPSNANLLFSFVGMKTQEISVQGQNLINVVMIDASIGLEEVVAVGYGTQKKANLTGAVETVNSDKIDWKPVGQTSMALQGVAPGVTVTQSSGQPGKDGGTIRIRGIGTLGTAGQNPLVLIDGIEGKINNVDPGDIQNISILKDAASASIYGSRAANGVILITTKRAMDTGRFQVSYDTYVGWQTPTDMPKVLNGLDHMLLLNEANRNMGASPTFPESYIEEYKKNAPSDLYPDTDWQKLTLTNDGVMQNHSIDVSGGSDLIRVRGSLVHFKQDGLIPNTGYNRNSLRLNSDIKASEKMSFKIDFRGSDELQYEPSTGMSQIFSALYGRVPRNMLGVLSDGRYGEGWLGQNPIAFANESGVANNRMKTFSINLQGDWSPFKNFDINFMYSPEFYEGYLRRFTHTIKTYYGDGRLAYVNPTKSELIQRSTPTKTNNLRILTNYTKRFGSNNLFFLVGAEQIEYDYESFEAIRENFQLENYQLLSLGSEENQKANGSAYDYSLRSFFGRVNYNLKDKYLLEANIRYDGSSRFAEGRKFGLFPSFSAGWRISEESFYKGIKEVVNEMKIRTSWGELGNQSIGNYPFTSSVNLQQSYLRDGIAVPGASLISLGNSGISWETTEMINGGVDLVLFEKLWITADVYIKDTRDILLQLPISATVGLNPPYQNAGRVKNTGWDLSISHRNIVGQFKYDVSLALSDVKNKVIDLVGTGPYISDRTIIKEGYPIDSFYGFKTAGLFNSPDEVSSHPTQFGGMVGPGDIKYINLNDDNIISADYDRTIIGSNIPRYTYSLGLNASYMGFDINMYFQGVGKVDSYRDQAGVWAFYVGNSAWEYHKENRWKPENPDASYPRLMLNYPNNEQVSDYWILDGSYLRMKNLQVGYTIPDVLISKTILSSLRFYFSGQNLFTIDNFLDGFDVEAPYGALSHYPMVKTFTFGINAKF